jgi:hypothetical protein
MYHPTVIDRRLTNLADSIRSTVDPVFAFEEYTVPEVQERVEALAGLYDPLTESTSRGLSVEEEAFVRHELSRCKVDFRYWATRYAFLKSKDMSLLRFQPTPVQDILLRRIADAELAAVSGKTGDGIIFACMKARQVGISTISEIIIAHRVFFYGNTTALVAADVEERSQNLYEMLVRILDNLPWWMRPKSGDSKRDYRVKNKQLYFSDQDSVVRIGSSSNMQGGDAGGDKGSLGTGMTLPLVHLSELALWNNPYQIDDALMPSIPMSPRTFAIFESTAKGRNNWWHEVWMDAKRGVGRRRAVFIPWYLDPTYRLPAATEWSPNATSLAHATRVAESSAQWCGSTVRLTRDQLYWWERTHADYASRKVLHKFLAEYAADDLEAFQNSTMGVFPNELLDDLRQKAAHQPIYIDVRPKMDMKAR